MKQYLLDTSIIIDYLRGKEKTVTCIDDLTGRITTSYMCLAELYEGAYRSHNTKKIISSIETFAAGLHRVYGLTQPIVEQFGKVRAELKTHGEVIEDIDIIIAATCIVHNLILVTNNIKHFNRIKGLHIYSE
jgi:tRNA(fMet)-specific endonuclease VapC